MAERRPGRRFQALFDRTSTPAIICAVLAMTCGIFSIVTREFRGRGPFIQYGEGAVSIGYMILSCSLILLWFALRLRGQEENPERIPGFEEEAAPKVLRAARFLIRLDNRPFQPLTRSVPGEALTAIERGRCNEVHISDTAHDSRLRLVREGDSFTVFLHVGPTMQTLRNTLSTRELHRFVADFLEGGAAGLTSNYSRQEE